MKKSCFILSIAGHALAILLFLNADFPIKMFYRPLRVIDIEISAPAPLFIATGSRARTGRDRPGSGRSANGRRDRVGSLTGKRRRGDIGKRQPRPVVSRHGRIPFAAGDAGDFHAAPETRSPPPAFGFQVPGGTPAGKLFGRRLQPGRDHGRKRRAGWRNALFRSTSRRKRSPPGRRPSWPGSSATGSFPRWRAWLFPGRCRSP